MLKITTLFKTRKKLLSLFVITCLLIPTLGLFYSFSTSKELRLGAKMPMADLKMDAATGSSYSLLDLKGNKGLIVVFSCNTCPFVVGNETFAGWEKDYNALFESAQLADMGMVLINSNEGKRAGEDSFEAMRAHAQKMDYKMKYLLDSNSILADAMGAKTTPHIFVFDSKNKLVYRGSIDNSWDNQRKEDILYLKNVINAIDLEQKITTKDTPPRGCSIKRIKVN